METVVLPAVLVLILLLLFKRGKKCPKCHIVLLFTAVFTQTYPQETEKPFIQEHKFHKHKIDIVNATVFQQIIGYSAVYNTTHIFFTEPLPESPFL
ncbi:hypothetical protein [Persephonella sp.]